MLSNAVDTAPRGRTPSGRPDGSVQLISTMRLARRKRPVPLLEMFRELRDQVEVPLHLTIVGDGPCSAGSDADMVVTLRRLVDDEAERWRISEHNRTIGTEMTWPGSLARHDRIYADAARRGVSSLSPAVSVSSDAVRP